MSDEINQISTFSHIDGVRKELDGKITTLQNDVKEKISMGNFLTILGIIVIILIAVFSYFGYQASQRDGKITIMGEDIAVIKSQLSEIKK